MTRLKMMTLVAGAFCLTASAANWVGSIGSNMDDVSNWSATPSSMNYVQKKAYLTLGAEKVDFFGGAGLRYNGKYVVTNDFGVGRSITNLGVNADSAFHVEGGCRLVQTSGGIVAYKGKAYNSSYITDNSTYCLDGPDAFFTCREQLTLRSNNAYSGAGFTYPTLIVTNGAQFSAATLSSGGGNNRSSGIVIVAGTGSKMLVTSSLQNGSATDSSVPSTNRILVTDGAFLKAKNLHAGFSRSGAQFEVSHGATAVSTDLFRLAGTESISNCAARILSGGVLTNQATTLVGFSNTDKGLHLLQVSGTGSLVKALGDVTVYKGSTISLEDAGALEITQPNKSLFTYGRTDVDGGRLDVVTNNVLAGGVFMLREGGFAQSTVQYVQNGGAWVADGGVVSNTTTTAYWGSTFNATNVSYNMTGDFLVGGNVDTVFKNSTLNYGRLMMGSGNGAVTFEDCVVSGRRIEMAGSNTTVRLINTHLTVTNAANSIFMMGDGNGGDAASNARERHVYIGGSNTWVKTQWSTYGLFVRGSNTTIHVEIPATGFSKEHPVFDLTRLSFQNNNAGWYLKVDVTVDPELAVRGGGTYTLFKGTNVQDKRVLYTYDPNLVSIDKSVADEVRIRVKNLSGTMILFR